MVESAMSFTGVSHINRVAFFTARPGCTPSKFVNHEPARLTVVS